jgi:dihydrofolate reductase
MKVSVYIATSLDGFIARKNGDIDWLMAADDLKGPEDYGYKEFWDSVDCMVMGRNTMEKVLSFPEWSYEGKRVIVLSSKLTEIPKQLLGKAELYSGSLIELVEKLESEGCKRLYIDGGKTIQSFINKGLLTDLTINKIPVLLGEGLPLFGKTKEDLKLKHIETIIYPNGFVKSSYEI